MKTASAVTLFLLTLMGFCHAQSHDGYYLRNDFLMTPPGASSYGLVGFSNPANLLLLKAPEHRFYWSSDGVNAWSFKNWGYFFGARHFGLGVQHQEIDGYKTDDFRLATAFGSDDHMAGISYGWSKGDNEVLGREKCLSAGSISRPFRYLSIGFVGTISLESDWNEAFGEIGIRPLGTPKLTVFADASIQKGMKLEDAPWSMGAMVEVIPGINATGRYFESEAFTFGLTLNFGRLGLGGQSHYDADQNHSYYTYHIRAGGMLPSVFPKIVEKDRRYLSMNMKGKVDHLKYVFFDSETLCLFDILKNIRAATNDPRVSVIALNLSGLRILPEHAWEVRKELQAAQASGKKVIIFIDWAEMTEYHLASVADKVVLDPEGSLLLLGYSMNRTYFKGTLEKLGVGFDEWRFYKYKSAAEGLSRDGMSDADREQRQDYIDDCYELTRKEVCASRCMSEEEFDRIIDEAMLLNAEAALASGLVDTLVRWSNRSKLINKFVGRKVRSVSGRDLLDNALPSQIWGEKPQIAIVYGLGECAMDSGIRARWLERAILELSKDDNVKAVVFRVDSPGGEALASDLVAEALKKCSKEKPVIVSQGQVAGSGGYWISMYGDSILAGPNSVTGSIGVIGGWVYDKGFGEKLGMTSDYVSRGKHADVGAGIRLPFLGFQVPSRNLTTEERSEIEEFIRYHYDRFVRKVAGGRDLTEQRVREIGEGHFYSGTKGKEIGLVDEIGGIYDAIAIARIKAGFDPDDEVELVEIPTNKGLFDFGRRLSPIGARLDNDPVYQYIKMVSDHGGAPLPLLLPGTYPSLEY